MKKNFLPIFIGVLLAIVGIGIMGNGLFNWDFKLFIDGWWALALMVMFVIFIIKDGPKLFNVLGAVVFGLIFVGYRIKLFSGINIWTVVVGIVILYFGARVIYDAVKSKNGKDDRIYGEAKEKDTKDL